MKIEFSTLEFERSHGKLPRGRGGWAFSEKRSALAALPPDGQEIIWTGCNLTLAEAKKEVKAKLAAMQPPPQGPVTLYILP